MSYKNFHYIIEIAQTQNITRAAEKLFISQSALSIHLQKLEKEYGCSFFIRDKNSLTLTSEGKMFVETAQEIMRLEEELRCNLSAGGARNISIGCSSEIAMQIASQVSYAFKKELPEVKVSLIDRRSDYLINSLKEKTLDLIIIPKLSLATDSWMAQEILKTEELVFVLPPNHSLAENASTDYNNPPAVDISVFKDQKFVIAPSDTVEYSLIKRIFNDAGIKPNIEFEINRTRQACQMVLDGMALSVQPSFCVPRDMGLLVCKPLKPYHRYLALLYRKDVKLRKEERRLIRDIKAGFDRWYD